MLNYMKLSFTLDGARLAVVEQLTSYTGRNARIDGKLELTVSFPPQLLVERIHISNIDGFSDEDFISLNEVKIEVAIWPLLSGKLHLSDISADQAKINLIQKKDGSHNWSFDNVSPSSKPAHTKTADSDNKKSGMSQISMGKFQLTDVSIVYRDASRDQIIKKQLDRLIIDLTDKTKPHAEISGNVQGYPYSITFTSDALEVLPSGKPWLLHGTGQLAGRQTDLEANLQLIEDEMNGNVDINVKNVNLGLLLDALGIISGQDAATDNINIKAKIRASDLAELYEQAEIRLQLGIGHWNLQTTETDQNKELAFTSASAFTSWNKPIELHVDGNIAGETIKLDFKTNRLLEFFDDVQKLDVDLVSNFAGTDLSMKGTLDLPVKTKQFQLDISLKVKDLEKLNPIINAEFPPFNDFSLSGNLIANKKGYVLKSAKASVGDSNLQTSIVIETNLAKPLWIINLSSHQLQLKDISFDDWNIKQPDTATVKTSKLKTHAEATFDLLHRLEKIVREPKMHFNLNVNVDKVLLGEDRLGKARFQLHLRDNAVSLKNADIEIPGGRITTATSIEIAGDEITGNTELNINKLDYGMAARMFKQGAQLNGIISARIDLQLAGRDFTRLLDNASGQLDIAVWPKNTKPAKILNLWATNLYLILLPELKKKESKVNCLVGLMDLDNGKMKEDFFAIDTTKLWIYGNFNVDFKQEHVSLSLFPRSKTARFFTLESPIRAQGSFSNINLKINPVDLTTGYISFIMSPLTVPTKWIFDDKPPEDGSAICEQLFDREYVIKLKAEVESKAKEEVDEMLKSD